MVQVQKNDTNIWKVFPNCVCGAALPQIGRLLLKIGRFLLKNRKASSEEWWVRMHISFQNTV